jgi:ABC-type uncharacterized transport system fused permease/ATPase subunit
MFLPVAFRLLHILRRLLRDYAQHTANRAMLSAMSWCSQLVHYSGSFQYLAAVIPRLHGFLPYFTLSLDFLNPLHFWPLPHLRRALASASTG